LQFNPVSPFASRLPWSAAHRDHRKLLIVDGSIAIMGGINISDDYSSTLGSRHKLRNKSAGPDLGSWRDTDIQIEGPAVAECQKLFIEHWMDQKAPPLAPRHYFVPLQHQGDEIVRMIGFTPKQPSEIYVTLISAMNNAERNVYITDAYFAPDRKILHAMEAAAKRGVDVRLLIPQTPEELMIASAARSHYEDLLESGVKIYEWRGKMLHAKTATVDQVWSTVGSSNLDWWSIARDDEVNATILSPAFGVQMEQMFNNDLKTSDAIDPMQWKSRSLIERLRETFARIFEPML
jgi:cardiolipin synthase